MEGLTTYAALKSIIEDLKKTLESHEKHSWTTSRWKNLVLKSILNVNQEKCSISWPSICLTILNVLVLGISGFQINDFWLVIEACLLFILLLINIVVNIYDQYLATVEMPRKLQNVVVKLERHLSNGVYWSQENYPQVPK